MDALGIERGILVGSSLGGFAALAMALMPIPIVAARLVADCVACHCLKEFHDGRQGARHAARDGQEPGWGAEAAPAVGCGDREPKGGRDRPAEIPTGTQTAAVPVGRPYGMKVVTADAGTERHGFALKAWPPLVQASFHQRRTGFAINLASCPISLHFRPASGPD